MTESPEQGGAGLFRRFFGGRRERNNKPAAGSETPNGQTDIPEPQWLVEQRNRLGAGVVEVAWSQSRQGPPSGGSIAPSVEGTGMSPFEAAARQGTLPPAVTGGSEAEQGKAKSKKQEKEDSMSKRKEKLQASLDLKAKSPK